MYTKILLSGILIFTNTSCISLTRLDEVKIDESATTEKIKIKKFNFYSQSGNSICIPQKDYDLIKENIEKFFVATDEDEVSYILYSKWTAITKAVA